jgi:flagella basal body P-ring formation protein FlgA
MTRLFLLRLVGATVLAALAAVLITLRPAGAATLKPTVTVTADVVTLGDLFDGAGALAETPAFRSPDAGVHGSLPAADALAAATAAGLAVDATVLDRITVVRAGTRIGESEFDGIVRASIADRLRAVPADLDIEFDGMVEPVMADAATDAPALLSSLSLQQGSGRFAARIAVDIGAGERLVEIYGRVTETREVPVLLREVDRREVIRAADVGSRRMDIRRLPRTAVRDAAEIVGMAARRPLRAGETVAASDVELPRLVLRGQLVTMTYKRPGLTLTARGRALSDAALGDTVSVLNEQSRRTVEGVVTANGVVTVQPAAPAAATAALTQ